MFETYNAEKHHVIYNDRETCCSDNESCDCNEIWFYDESRNLDKIIETEIIAIALVGRWNGQFSGYKMIGDNLKNILNLSTEHNVVFSDGRNIRSVGFHHDGVNYILYRQIKPNVDPTQLQNKIYNDTVTWQDVLRYTTSIAPEINKIYGWKGQKKGGNKK